MRLTIKIVFLSLTIIILGCSGIKRNNYSLEKAIRDGNIKRVEALLRSGVDLNATTSQGPSLLETAVIDKKYDIAKLLIKNGAKITHSEGTPFKIFWHCFMTNDLKMLKLLLDSGVNVNKPIGGITLLHRAAGFPTTTLTMEIIDRGANVNAVSKDLNQTPIYSSIFNDDVAGVKLLLNRGAHPCVVDRTGVSPYCFSKLYARKAIQKMLLGCPNEFEVCKANRNNK